MRATIIRDFFLGGVSAEQLAVDLAEPWTWTSSDSRRLSMQDLHEDFQVEAEHLVRLCLAVEEGTLPPNSLEPIGFGLIASDHFVWDTDTVEGERVGETLYDWSCPEVNFALTSATAYKFRRRLETGENLFTTSDHYTGPLPGPASKWSNHPDNGAAG